MKFNQLTVSLFVAVCASSCSIKHSSRMHADQACNEWMSEENLLSYERELLGFEKRTKFEAENPRPDAAYWDDEVIDWENKKAAYASQPITESENISSRYCMDDSESMKFMGYENNAIKNGTYKDLPGEKGDWVLVKIFRY